MYNKEKSKGDNVMTSNHTLQGAIVLQAVNDFLLWSLEEHEGKRILDFTQSTEYCEREIKSGYFESILNTIPDYANITGEQLVLKLKRRAKELIAAGVTAKAWKTQTRKLTINEKRGNI